MTTQELWTCTPPTLRQYIFLTHPQTYLTAQELWTCWGGALPQKKTVDPSNSPCHPPPPPTREVGDDDGGGEGNDDGRISQQHAIPIHHALRDIISSKGKSLSPIYTYIHENVSKPTHVALDARQAVWNRNVWVRWWSDVCTVIFSTT